MNWKKFLPLGVREHLDISRWSVTAYMHEVAVQIPSGHLILDAGAGDSRYRSLFAGRDYVGVDAAVGKGLQYSGLDALSDLAALPFPDKTFDAALCMNVLEHVRQPDVCLGEIYRVLKPQGVVYLLVPLFAREHQAPHDYYRFTANGINFLLEQSGFAVDYFRPVGGYFRVLAGILSRATGYLFPRRRAWTFRLLFSPFEFVAKPLFSVLVPLVCLGLDPLDRKQTYTTGFSCKGRKVPTP
jgi:SAM-dependent methyltransferase